jgi:hypothetical protein
MTKKTFSVKAYVEFSISIPSDLDPQSVIDQLDVDFHSTNQAVSLETKMISLELDNPPLEPVAE